MGRVSKAARGKHRWIGVRGDMIYKSREELKQIVSQILENCEWKLYDIKFIDSKCVFIIKVQLENYEKILNLVNLHDSFETLTSSGKINLIRERIF
jgi:hypothetical protein